MGDGIAGHISKGIIHQMVDACINSKDASGAFHKRAAFLQGLIAANTSQQYRALIESQAGVLGGEHSPSEYLRDTWYNEGVGGFWKTLQPLYPILRMGLIKAITLAGTTLPVESYWLPLPGFPSVEVLVMKSQTQVVRLILTPPSELVGSKRTKDVDMWVVSKKTSDQEVKDFETIDQVVEDVVEGVVTWRRRELPPPGPKRK